MQGQSSRFIRISWEDIYSQILKHDASLNDSNRVIEYFKNKSIGYDGFGKLQKAFSLIPTKKELQEMREKFKDDKEMLEVLKDNKTVD